MIRLFIVDDHYMVVEGIRALLTDTPGIELMAHASGAESCMAFLRGQQPDVILMDISLPGMSGIELCALVKAQYPGIAVLALSTHNQGSYIRRMLEQGADGYLLKNAGKDEIIQALNMATKGRRYLSFEAAAAIRRQPQQQGPVLTRRETEVLGLIAHGYTNAEIAERLFVSPATVDSHRKNVLAKLEARNTADLVRIAAAKGWIEEEAG